MNIRNPTRHERTKNESTRSNRETTATRHERTNNELVRSSSVHSYLHLHYIYMSTHTLTHSHLAFSLHLHSHTHASLFAAHLHRQTLVDAGFPQRLHPLRRHANCKSRLLMVTLLECKAQSMASSYRRTMNSSATS